MATLCKPISIRAFFNCYNNLTEVSVPYNGLNSKVIKRVIEELDKEKVPVGEFIEYLKRNKQRLPVFYLLPLYSLLKSFFLSKNLKSSFF